VTAFSSTLFTLAKKSMLMKLDGDVVTDSEWEKKGKHLKLTIGYTTSTFEDQPLRLGRTIKTAVVDVEGEKHTVEFFMLKRLTHDDICELL
jgi:hypothetical protein